MRAVLLVLVTGCSYVATHGPPAHSELSSVPRAELACTTDYGAPMADLLAGGVASLPAFIALGYGLHDAGVKSNGGNPPDRDWHGWLILGSTAVALVFAASAHTGQARVYACRRARGLPIEGEHDRELASAEQRALEARERCRMSVPSGSPDDVELRDRSHAAIAICGNGRGGGIVIHGSAPDTRAPYSDDIRHELRRRMNLALAIGHEAPPCDAAQVDRATYLSVSSWSHAGLIASFATTYARELPPTQAIVVAVVPPCRL
ncbi:MAG TPA: hypothetical protein VFQ53_13775 [Kofleriaceae bacterium]|nr:hypothetical protein [Kofleriaceae bacterium]